MRQKKQKIRQINNTLRQQPQITPLQACKIIVQQKHEARHCTYKYKSWWDKRALYMKGLKNSKSNISGQGRKRSTNRMKQFKQVDVLFEFYRYTMKIPMRLNDVGDLFIKAAQFLNISYNESHAYWDAQAWKKYSDARDNSLNGKIKYKPDYIAATVASNQTKLQLNITKYNIPIHKQVSIDETCVWSDFALPTKTLSLPNRNEPVIWIPNDKDTTTIIGVWCYNKLRFDPKISFV